jgi:ABC-2 type transport system ATP-binding protein
MYLIPEMAVKTHLRTLFLIKGIPIKVHSNIMSHLLSLFNMKEEEEKEIRHLSAGSKRKLSLISALVAKPRYLFLDEPTIGVDIPTQKIFGKFIDLLTARFGTTVIWITHKIEEAEKHCSRVGIITRG